MTLSGVEGSIHSPGFGQTFSSEDYRLLLGKEIHYKLNVADTKNLMHENDFLKLTIEVDTEYENDVRFAKNVRYVVFEEELSWYQAEASCESKGGHLVSVTTQKEQDEVKALAKAEHVIFFWYGATDEQDGSNGMSSLFGIRERNKKKVV